MTEKPERKGDPVAPKPDTKTIPEAGQAGGATQTEGALTMSDWTGCEGGACVQYRTDGDKVFVRSSDDPDRQLEFTVAEWDAFVAGLVGDKVCFEHGDYPEVVAAYEHFVAENAHLHELLAGMTTERASILTVTEKMLAETRQQRDAYRDELEDMRDQRNTFVTEAAVLRHRDRRTQAVVEAAKDLLLLKDGPRDEAYREGKSKAWSALRTALARIDPNGPCSPAQSTLPAEQAQVVPESTPGPETQGEAQGAGAVIWHHGCGRTYTADGGPLDCECGDYTGQWSTYFNSTAPPIVDDGTAIKVQWNVPGPRVWNVGDPEPEGVEKVRDDDGCLWIRTGTVWLWTDEQGNTNAIDWAPLTFFGTLTEVLPEPAPVADNDHDPDGALTVTMDNTDATFVPTEPLTPVPWKGGPCTCDLCESGRRLYAANHPDGEVPEAGRAGEAQRVGICGDTLHPAIGNGTLVCDLPAGHAGWHGCAQVDTTVRANWTNHERTAGLDAAIEAKAGTLEFRNGDTVPIGQSIRLTTRSARSLADPAICGSEYVRDDRIVRCGVEAGHLSDHDEMINGMPGNYWPQANGGEAADLPRSTLPLAVGAPAEASAMSDPDPSRYDGCPSSASLPVEPAWLIEALEVAEARYELAYGGPHDYQSLHQTALDLAVRAAAPLIERAALLAAADDWDVHDVHGVADDFSAWLRDRATRTETS